MVKKITFVGFWGGDRPPWIRPWPKMILAQQGNQMICKIENTS